MNNNNFLNIATLMSPNFLLTRLVAIGTFLISNQFSIYVQY